MRKVCERTSSRIKMAPASTYRSLPEMVEAGLVESLEPPEDADRRRRRYYRITVEGTRVLAAQVRFMEEELSWAREAGAKLGASSPRS